MRTCLVLSLVIVITAVSCRPQDQHGSNLRPPEPPLRTHFRTDAVYRANKGPALRDTMDIVAKQLTEANSTDFTMDTRTPPRIKLQQRNSMKNKSTPKPEKPVEEPSHPGVAVPVDVDTLVEATTMRQEQKTSTDSGLSTWILLSGNSPSTAKPVRTVPVKTTTQKPVVSSEKSTSKLVTMIEKVMKTTPKPKTTTTRKPTTTTRKPTTTTTVGTTTFVTKMMNKIKASVLNNAINNKTKTPITPVAATTVMTTAASTTKTTTRVPTTTTITTTTKKVEESTKKTGEEKIENNTLKPEAKVGEVELPDTKVPPKRPTKRPASNPVNKRKKNKTRRRKPEANVSTKNNIKVNQKEKPIGTQIYNYLSREVMPTVGVGLVGLVVTAGLASYFLFPFSGLRRNFEGATDRRDDHFYDNYMDGELEQDVIGKMIEGGFEYSNSFSNSVYQPYDRYAGYDNAKQGYNNDRIIAERQKESGYTVDDRKFEQKQFVVGNVPDSFVPVTVPEHGPRSLRIRRSALPKEEDNEISNHRTKYTKYKETLKQKADAINESLTKSTTTTTTTETITTTDDNISTESTTPISNSTTVHHRPQANFFSFFRSLFEMKVRLGLDFLANTTETVSKYLRRVQNRVEHVIKENHDRYNTSYNNKKH